MENILINLNDVKNRLMYLGWFLFFVAKTVFSKYIGLGIEIRAIVILTLTYLFVQFYHNGNIFINFRKIDVLKGTLLVAPFIIYANLSVHWGTQVVNASYVVNNMLKQNLIVFICLEIFWGNKDRIKDLLKIYCAAMFIYGFVATFTTPIGSWGSEYKYGGFTAIHRNAASVIFVVCFGICYYLYEMYKDKKYIIAMFSFLFFNLVTGARKGIIQTIFIIAMIVLLQNGLQKKFRLMGVLLVVVSVLAIIFINSPFLQETYGARLLAIFDDSIHDGSRDFRKMFRIWAFVAFLLRPIIGHGSAFTVVVISTLTGEAVYSHCNYTEMLANYGLIGFALNYMVYLVCLVKSFKNRVNSMGKMVFTLVLSILIIEYGQVTYQILSSLIPLYIVFLAGLYGMDNTELTRKEV